MLWWKPGELLYILWLEKVLLIWFKLNSECLTLWLSRLQGRKIMILQISQDLWNDLAGIMTLGATWGEGLFMCSLHRVRVFNLGHRKGNFFLFSETGIRTNKFENLWSRRTDTNYLSVIQWEMWSESMEIQLACQGDMLKLDHVGSFRYKYRRWIYFKEKYKTIGNF